MASWEQEVPPSSLYGDREHGWKKHALPPYTHGRGSRGHGADTPADTCVFERIRHAEPVATVGDQGVGLTAAGRVTRREERTVEDA